VADSRSGRHLLRGPSRLRCTAASCSQRIGVLTGVRQRCSLVCVCICLWLDCQYLLSSPLRDGQEMSEGEQQRVFGLQPPDQKRASGGSAGGDQRDFHGDLIIMLDDIDFGSEMEPAVATAAAAAAAAAAGPAAVEEDLFVDME